MARERGERTGGRDKKEWGTVEDVEIDDRREIRGYKKRRRRYLKS